MHTITPTASQAAVVLKKFLAEQGIELQLAKAQEAIARMNGYKDWQALVAGYGARKPQRAVASVDISLQPLETLGMGDPPQDLPTTVLTAGRPGATDLTPAALELAATALESIYKQPPVFVDISLEKPDGSKERFEQSFAPLSATTTSRISSVSHQELALRLTAVDRLLMHGGVVRIERDEANLLAFAEALATDEAIPESLNSRVAFTYHVGGQTFEVFIRDLRTAAVGRRFEGDENIAFALMRGGSFVLEGAAENIRLSHWVVGEARKYMSRTYQGSVLQTEAGLFLLSPEFAVKLNLLEPEVLGPPTVTVRLNGKKVKLEFVQGREYRLGAAQR